MTKSFSEAFRGDSREYWIRAMNEITYLTENQTWNLEKLPRGRKAIPCKWKFKINPDRSISKYKASEEGAVSCQTQTSISTKEAEIVASNRQRIRVAKEALCRYDSDKIRLFFISLIMKQS